jgi:molybdopterin/thiamine biosynthesis adenylyltransferase
MIEITLGSIELDRLRRELFVDGIEHCTALLASQVVRSDGLIRLLVRERVDPDSGDYSTQTPVHVELAPAFVARVAKLAKLRKSSLIFVHNHPGQKVARFSVVDDAGERRLADFLAVRHPGNLHASLVLSEQGTCARQLGEKLEARVVALGENRVVLHDPDRSDDEVAETFDRQVRAFGAAGQRAISKLVVGIVGLGGTGSIVTQQLAHLGVRHFILIDPDTIESTNLNRVVGATPADVGLPKVEVAARYIANVAPVAVVASIRGDIIRARTAAALVDADMLFGCTDSHGSRAVLQQIAYQYLIPCIDMGSTIVASEGLVTKIYGRVQLLAPGRGCLNCAGLLNSEEIRRDMMNAFERKLDPYLQGAREPAPAVVSLNGTVASLAVTMFMAVVTGISSPARYLLYNATTSSLRNVRADAVPNCYICSPRGAYAKGNLQPLFARQD